MKIHMLLRSSSIAAFSFCAALLVCTDGAYAENCSAIADLQNQSAALQIQCDGAQSTVSTLTSTYNARMSAINAKFASLPKRLRKKYSRLFKRHKTLVTGIYKGRLRNAQSDANTVCGRLEQVRTQVVALLDTCNADPYRDWPVKPVEINATPENSANMTALADGVLGVTSAFWSKRVVEKLFHYKISDACWSRMLDAEGQGFYNESFVARDAKEYTVRVGFPDAERVETADDNDRPEHRAQSEAVIDSAQPKIQFTVWAPELNCDELQWSRYYRFSGYPLGMINLYNRLPKSGVLFLTVVITPRITEISARASDDGLQLYLFMPANNEPEQWDTKVQLALEPYLRRVD